MPMIVMMIVAMLMIVIVGMAMAGTVRMLVLVGMDGLALDLRFAVAAAAGGAHKQISLLDFQFPDAHFRTARHLHPVAAAARTAAQLLAQRH